MNAFDTRRVHLECTSAWVLLLCLVHGFFILFGRVSDALLLNLFTVDVSFFFFCCTESMSKSNARKVQKKDFGCNILEAVGINKLWDDVSD